MYERKHGPTFTVHGCAQQIWKGQCDNLDKRIELPNTGSGSTFQGRKVAEYDGGSCARSMDRRTEGLHEDLVSVRSVRNWLAGGTRSAC